jgi:DNA polymerase-4/DNA polymerase V
MILHFDCDAFFASVAQALNPAWQGKPVVTGHERGIISSASYEAKAYGIKRGVAMWDIKKLCPQCVIIDTDYYACELYSQRVLQVVQSVCPVVCRTSIDEGYADLSGMTMTDPLAFIQNLQRQIASSLNIGVSFGIGSTATLAKAGSKARKPAGAVVVTEENREKFLNSLKLSDICGWGPVSVHKLQDGGCRTPLDFIRWTRERAGRVLGQNGEELWLELNGTPVFNPFTDGRDVPLTCTSSRTIVAVSDPATLWAQALRHVQHVCHDLRQQGLVASKWAIWLRRQPPAWVGDRGAWYRTASIEGRAISIAEPTNLPWAVTSDLYQVFCRCYRADGKYRSVGVTASSIVPLNDRQLGLFCSSALRQRGEQLAKAMDTVNDRFGHDTVLLASALSASRRHADAESVSVERREQRLAYPLVEMAV